MLICIPMFLCLNDDGDLLLKHVGVTNFMYNL